MPAIDQAPDVNRPLGATHAGEGVVTLKEIRSNQVVTWVAHILRKQRSLPTIE
ncbi:hypothetical protein C8E87_3144 [Paractinoplanes brasiliensis]|uniref:Uncharacterized protein n=1 Tax=Paractinoplanes brasiliensis TaxID=52695 RepID=A0A4R6JWA5_9ACTN|nr:hypothetical protein C8E87_3144 [Actinoplanes brasiliensis]GID32746.1 hypothetical protein Abr02nite_77290 [Actinoplanes brasiliensis]